MSNDKDTQLKQSKFGSIMQDVHGEIDRLSHGVNRLRSHIDVVLVPESQMVENRPTGGANSPVLSEFEAGMRLILERINSLAIQVESMSDRCSL